MNIIRLKTFYVIFLNLSTNMFPTTLTSSKADNKSQGPPIDRKERPPNISVLRLCYILVINDGDGFLLISRRGC